jgi:hypothetical protein
MSPNNFLGKEVNLKNETFEKCSILFKAKEGENFNHPCTIYRTYPSTICRSYGAGGAGRNTFSISRIKI